MKNLKDILLQDNATEWKNADIVSAAEKNGFRPADAYRLMRSMNRVKRGVYTFENVASPAQAPRQQSAPSQQNNVIAFRGVSSVTDDEIFIPDADPTFVRWGEYTTLSKIIKSGMFFPTYVSGMSGNGKTFMIEQACAQHKREYVRVQISPETDEDDLIGGFRLIEGETVFQKGPVIKAMERGCILLIDEIDRASNKIMCLQGVLEGKPVLLKKTGEVVIPAEGFNVIATANTKGRGSDDGRYSAATIIDDAFLERFTALIDQPFATPQVESKILTNHALKYEMGDTEFLTKLIAWANVVRKTFDADAIDDVVSTRRLCHIIKANSIFDNRIKSIEMFINRFDPEVKEAFMDLYSKIDSSQLDDEGNIISGEMATETSDDKVIF